MKSAQQALTRLRSLGSPRDAAVAVGFFKTGPGEYGEGDVFIGVRMPQIRLLLRECDELPESAVIRLLSNPIHEARMLALLIFVRRFKRGDEEGRGRIYELYLRHRQWINNWDLVDLSAEHVVGGYLAERERTMLDQLAGSARLWDRRIAVLATFHFIRNREFAPTLRLTRHLMDDSEDLMHKALGWMLREIGKRDRTMLDDFLRQHYRKMPRTMLRYAIEHYEEQPRLAFLKGTI